jgi:hypothetical protein
MVIHDISHHPGSQEFALFWTIFIGLGRGRKERRPRFRQRGAGMTAHSRAGNGGIKREKATKHFFD